jgi:hypothetical protein
MWDAPPNAILNDLAGAPFSVGKFAAYSDSNSDHGIIWVIFTQRLSADNLDPLASSKSKGGRGASSAFLYMSAGCDARVLHYSTCLSCTLLSIARSSNPGQVTRDRYIQQTLSTEEPKMHREITIGVVGKMVAAKICWDRF